MTASPLRLPSLATLSVLFLATFSVACAKEHDVAVKAAAPGKSPVVLADARETMKAPAQAAAATTPAAATAPAAPPVKPLDPQGDELVVLDTTAGRIVIDLFEDKAPGHAENMKKLVRQGYYTNSPFHRVIPGFMAQGGGQWNPQGPGGVDDVGYTIPAEIVPGLRHVRGAVAAARKGDQVNPQRESSGSQFYICFVDTPHLDGGYSIFGEVVEGMDNVDKIVPGPNPPTAATIIKSATLQPKPAK